MNRRELFTAGAASLTATAVPRNLVALPQSEETPIMRAFRQWKAERAAAHGVSEEECEAAVNRMCALEDQMMEIRSTSLADLGAKIAAWTSFGDISLPDAPHPFRDEISDLMGEAY